MKPLARILTGLVLATAAAGLGSYGWADGVGGSGIVASFRSVVIDGVHYQTDNAIIRLNGRQALESDLKVGYHVRYRADGDTLEAWSMDYYDTLAGTLEAVTVVDEDMQILELEVLGQRVRTDAVTWIHGADIDSLAAGMPVAISAEWLPDGILLASAVDVTARPEQVLSGRIDSVEGDRLSIGGVTIDASSAGSAPNGEALKVGEWVHALGEYDGSPQSPGALTATRLVRQADGDVSDLPGTIQGVLSNDAGIWKIRDHALLLDEALSAGLVAGRRVTVTGALRPSGEFQVSELRMEGDERFRVDGAIEAVHGDGTAITVGGVTVQLDERTTLRDDRDGYRWLSPDTLGTHDAVSLVVERIDGVLRARKVRRDAELRQILRAIIEEFRWWDVPKLLQQRQAGVFGAREAFYNGEAIATWKLRFRMKAGDRMTLRYDDDGEVVRAEVFADDYDDDGDREDDREDDDEREDEE
ncbi:MAG: DUF5666 domain-containing protein [Pseudomonadota bacterium]